MREEGGGQCREEGAAFFFLQFVSSYSAEYSTFSSLFGSPQKSASLFPSGVDISHEVCIAASAIKCFSCLTSMAMLCLCTVEGSHATTHAL